MIDRALFPGAATRQALVFFLLHVLKRAEEESEENVEDQHEAYEEEHRQEDPTTRQLQQARLPATEGKQPEHQVRCREAELGEHRDLRTKEHVATEYESSKHDTEHQSEPADVHHRVADSDVRVPKLPYEHHVLQQTERAREDQH